MKSFCSALFVLNILYCTLALVQDGLPGWHMFESVPRIHIDVADRTERPVELGLYLPRGARIVDRHEVHAVARFVCEKERARAPFLLHDWIREERVAFGPIDCAVHERP